jgi:hypothetical protein
MKGTKLLEARIKAKEQQKVKSFMPNEVAGRLDPEDAKVGLILLSVSSAMGAYTSLRPNPPTLRLLQQPHRDQNQRRNWELQLLRSPKHP